MQTVMLLNLTSGSSFAFLEGRVVESRDRTAWAGGSVRKARVRSIGKDDAMSKRYQYHGLAILLALVWGDAAHWLITPHPEAGDVREALVWIQLLVGLGFFAWAIWKGRQDRRPDEPQGEGGAASA
jgi:hypothetical protein